VELPLVPLGQPAFYRCILAKGIGEREMGAYLQGHIDTLFVRGLAPLGDYFFRGLCIIFYFVHNISGFISNYNKNSIK
jgi:hypothetical protein